ncbi:MAG: hypothetical protein K0S71_192 [Clostridia bacterium]|jgi:cytoskeletal protein CcmA (bactofilin family)|nr:hypothetical protein [Clostridia bacterium]
MFGDSKTKVSQIGTLIDTTASLKGDIVTEGNLRIDGKFHGNIISAKDVVIGEEGLVQGQINAETMAIYGIVKGNIKSGGLVEIMSTGKVFGDIEVNRLVIKEGGVFEGKSLMKQMTPSERDTE